MLRTATFLVMVLVGWSGAVRGADPAVRVPTDSQSEVLPYEEAYRRAQQERKPLVILVGADWCAACKTMKHDTIVPMQESGALREVVYTQLDKDGYARQDASANRCVLRERCGLEAIFVDGDSDRASGQRFDP